MENKAWERSLEFFRQENALLKYRLSEIVDHTDEKNLLTLAEYFQNEFVAKDEEADHLLKLIRLLSDKLSGKTNDAEIEMSLLSKQEKLRNKILIFENDFLQLSTEFNARMQQTV